VKEEGEKAEGESEGDESGGERSKEGERVKRTPN
jgi:hypothetical protein